MLSLGMATRLSAAVFAALFVEVLSHGMLLEPLSRAARMMVTHPSHHGLSIAGDCTDSSCIWYTQQAYVRGKVTNCEARMRTLGVHCGSHNPDDFPCIGPLKKPWCSPGATPVSSPCGIFNGGYAQGGRDMRDLPGPVQAVWTVGSAETVVHAITANHGGGYSYRLCPADHDLTEECFQQHPLDFASNVSWVLDRMGKAVAEFKAERTSIGTHPAGSQWTRNPIPMEADVAMYGTPKYPGLYGPGPASHSIKDVVRVPKLPNGKYVLSYRWDAESVSQVWQSCSDIEITGSALSPRATPKRRSVCIGNSWGLDVDECDAWVEFFDALGGPGWNKCSQHRLDPCGCTEGRWGHLIVCNSFQDYQHIHEIYLLENNMKGQIPSSIHKFSTLLALDLSENDIYGSVPAELGEIGSLGALWLHHNPKLGGPLPRTLLKPNFYALELQACNFSGPLPPMNFWNISNCLVYGNVFECPCPEQAKSCGCACRQPSLHGQPSLHV